MTHLNDHMTTDCVVPENTRFIHIYTYMCIKNNKKFTTFSSVPITYALTV